MNECRMCLGICDPVTHEATLSIHAWFKGQILMDRNAIVAKRPNPGIDEVRRLKNGMGDFPKSVPGPGWKDFR
jgi:hypothetical protein